MLLRPRRPRRGPASRRRRARAQAAGLARSWRGSRALYDARAAVSPPPARSERARRLGGRSLRRSRTCQRRHRRRAPRSRVDGRVLVPSAARTLATSGAGNRPAEIYLPRRRRYRTHRIDAVAHRFNAAGRPSRGWRTGRCSSTGDRPRGRALRRAPAPCSSPPARWASTFCQHRNRPPRRPRAGRGRADGNIVEPSPPRAWCFRGHTRAVRLNRGKPKHRYALASSQLSCAATDEEVRAASLQYVRKISGSGQ